MGSSLNSSTNWLNANYDMTDMMTDSTRWYKKTQEYLDKPAWYHSDFKDSPYVHVWKVFEKITSKGKTNENAN